MQENVVREEKGDATSRTERAYQRLRKEILSGELAPDLRLRAADLEERFGLGLTPIREALVRLSMEGLVAVESNRGARVRGISAEEFVDLMQTRRGIERLCLAESIRRGDASWEAEAIASLHMLTHVPLPDFGSTTDISSEWETQHRRFHTALVSACGSEWLLQFWNQLVDHSERYRKMRLHGPLIARGDVRAEHQALLDAALGRNVDAAVTLMEQHLRGTEEAVKAAMGWSGRN
ncbi:GntR family transcriptional regulator [Comamonas testosteroni]|uniref:GntR family transcriptional regulator n=1 Tax=Comamonas testosteroni TaxID=285 RepID=A0A5A7MJD7_COMTE|nr:FCD domain-containing protein [Comamonas testosteroni]GEQ77833.1 GntR family transcriptional regulator [Comamonas testosteroni]